MKAASGVATFQILITDLWEYNFSDNSEAKSFWNLKIQMLVYNLWGLNSQDYYATSSYHFLLGSPGVSYWDRFLGPLDEKEHSLEEGEEKRYEYSSMFSLILFFSPPFCVSLTYLQHLLIKDMILALETAIQDLKLHLPGIGCLAKGKLFTFYQPPIFLSM